MFSPTQIRSFVTALEEGTLSAAARKLGLTQPAVSQHLMLLEREAGQDLVIRTRKGVQATQAGEVMQRHGQKILAEMETIHERLYALKGEVSGRLTVTTNKLFGQTLFLPITTAIKFGHPRLKLVIKASDDLLDLEADGIDMAVRSGVPGQGAGLVRRIAQLEMVLAASPAYLDRVGRPSGPGDLARLSYIQYNEAPHQTHIVLSRGADVQEVPVTPACDAQDPNFVFHAIESGLGFARVPRFVVEEGVTAGKMEVLVPDMAPAPKPIFLIQTAATVETGRNALFRRLLFAQIEERPFMALSASARAELKTAAHGLDPVAMAT